MNEIEQTNRQIHSINNSTRQRRSQRQRISPSPEPQLITTTNQSSPLDLSHSSQLFNKANQISSTPLPNTDNLNPLSAQSKMTNNLLQTPAPIEQQRSHVSDSLSNPTDDIEIISSNNSPSSTLSTSDVDSFERMKQIALAKVEAKLEKAQRLSQSAQHSIEQSISELLRITAIPGINESNSSKTTKTACENRIRTLQETKKELEKKISNYQADINRILSGDISHKHTSSKDNLNNAKTIVMKPRSSEDVSTSNPHEQSIISNHQETDNHPSSTTNNFISAQNSLSLSQNSNTLEALIRKSPSNSISNEIGHSQFYIDSNYDYTYDGDKANRKHDSDFMAIHDMDKSPSTKRKLTDDSNMEFNDRISDHSSDDRYISYNSSKRNTMTTIEYQQLMLKIDSMHKTIEHYDAKMTQMQGQIDTLTATKDSQNKQNDRLNNELTDLTDLHQVEMSAIKNDLRKLEEKLLYNFQEYWTEMVEKLDKLDTRTTKVEQTLTHSLETEENTHRLISKFVNILLTVFAIILLLLSTVKNLVQSRVHAVILLILVFTWITIRYLPENYSPNFTNVFKRTS